MWAFPLITLPGSLCVKFYKGIDMFALDSGDLNSNYLNEKQILVLSVPIHYHYCTYAILFQYLALERTVMPGCQNIIVVAMKSRILFLTMC